MRFTKLILIFFVAAVTINSCANYKIYENGHVNHDVDNIFSYKNSTNDSCLVFGQDDILSDSAHFIKELKIKFIDYSYDFDYYQAFSENYSLTEVAKEQARLIGANAIRIKKFSAYASPYNRFLIVDFYKLDKQSYNAYHTTMDSLLLSHKSILHIKILKGYYQNATTNVYYNDGLTGKCKFLKKGIPDNPIINSVVYQKGTLSLMRSDELNKLHGKKIDNAINWKYLLKTAQNIDISVGKEYFIYVINFQRGRTYEKYQELRVVTKYEY